MFQCELFKVDKAQISICGLQNVVLRICSRWSQQSCLVFPWIISQTEASSSPRSIKFFSHLHFVTMCIYFPIVFSYHFKPTNTRKIQYSWIFTHSLKSAVNWMVFLKSWNLQGKIIKNAVLSLEEMTARIDSEGSIFECGKKKLTQAFFLSNSTYKMDLYLYTYMRGFVGMT